MKEKQLLEHEKQISEYERTITQVKEQNKQNPILSQSEISNLEKKLQKLKKKVYSELTPWDRVTISRHPQRPRSVDYIKGLSSDFQEIHGDRLFRDDPAIITGFATIGGVKFAIMAQEKGCDTESRLHRNFGMPHPEGYRKALRLMKMAEKFCLPILSLIDTPGAFPGLTAEERGQGSAIAQNLWEMARLATPLIVVLIGEGCSGGALGMAVGDVVGMLKHSYYSVISPEACASILWKETSKNKIAAEILRMHAEDLLKMGIVDSIIEEPMGGAHYAPEEVIQHVKEFALDQWKLLKGLPSDLLLEQRYQKFRRLGSFIEETTQVEKSVL